MGRIIGFSGLLDKLTNIITVGVLIFFWKRVIIEKNVLLLFSYSEKFTKSK